jgi:hypothetical protein
MSGQLDLSFSHQGGPDVGELPVVVDVVDASLEVAAQPRLVQLASGWRQDLEPGTYLVRVRFPSGQEIRQTCTVRDGDHIPISVDMRRLAGHESLERSAALRPVARDERTPGLAGTRFAEAWVRRWRGNASREWQPIDFDGITVGGDDYTIQYRFQYRLASAPPSNVLQLGAPRIAWQCVSLPAAPVVDVTVSPRGENDLAVEVTTGSTEAEALLGYLRTGAVEGADVTAESLLQQKRRDPIAAAIGGYYLLRTANLDRLSDWGPNLSQWFPWLADGAVINGWQHIHAGREHREDPDWHFGEARQQLIQAAQRGVPVYTEGLRLLVDGLRLLREDGEAEDAELDAALTFIEPFAMAADWSAATVTYSGADPAEPHSRHRYGIPKDHDQLVLLRPQAEVAAARVASEATDRNPDLVEARDLALDLARALNLARDLAALARDLTRARNLALDIAGDLDRALDRDITRAQDLDRDRAHYITRAQDLDRARLLARDLDRALARGLDRGLGPVGRDLVRDLAEALRRAHDLAEALRRAQERAGDDGPLGPG